MPRSIAVFEDSRWIDFLPLTYVRPPSELVCGAWNLRGRVERLSGGQAGVWCREEIAAFVAEETGTAVNAEASEGTLLLNGRALWSELPDAPSFGVPWVGVAGEDDAVVCIACDRRLAATLSPAGMLSGEGLDEILADVPRVRLDDVARLVDRPWELNRVHQELLANDLALLVQAPPRERPGVHFLNPSAIHVAESARIDPCVVLDATEGPIVVADGARVSPMCTIQGPAYVGPGSLLQPGATIRHASWIGPVCKVGGEIEASILHGFSNKQHDGFLGHSYVGSWVNIAADCINSDLKNTYGTVRVPIRGEDVETGEMFVGAIVGDHAKIGINASLPTGCVVGFSSNAVASLLPKFVPSFAWHQAGVTSAYDVERAVSVARRVVARRKRTFTRAAEAALRHAHATAMLLEAGQPVRA